MTQFPRACLPRLSPEAYQGHAFVHWTYPVRDRKTGWLDERFHFLFREGLLHALHRYQLACPTYALMPDHLHLLVVGLDLRSDQLKFNRFFRKRVNQLLAPRTLQSQGRDHVLRERERERNAFSSVSHYIFQNPVRAAIASSAEAYPYAGCLFPGYYDLNPHTASYWDLFWKKRPGE